MKNMIIACIDGSTHADSVCLLSAWASNKLNYPVSLLHVVAPHSDIAAKGNLSGSIGLGAKSDLLKELTEVDEARGKLELKKGQLMLTHASEVLVENGVINSDILHRRGSLVDTLAELEPDCSLIVIGKRGENASGASDHLGSNLERVARAIHTPLLVTTETTKPIKKILIAYDGGKSARKAIDFALSNSLLKGMECHLLQIGHNTHEATAELTRVGAELAQANYSVTTSLQEGSSVENIVSNYVKTNEIDLLVIGSYGHSKLRNLFIGSTTTALIHKSSVPILLFS